MSWHTSGLESHVLSYRVALACLCVLDSLNFMSLEREHFDSLGFMDTGPLGLRDGWAARALPALWFYPRSHLETFITICTCKNDQSADKQSRSFSGYILKPRPLCLKSYATCRCRSRESLRNIFPLAHSLLVCSKRAKWWIPRTLVRVNGGASKFLFSLELTDRW